MTDERSIAFRELLAKDFRTCLYYVWKKQGLPDPTPLQYDIANYLQDTGQNRIIIEAFRGVGKSFITAAFCVWCWLRNPNCRIMVVSGSAGRANKFANMVKAMIDQYPAFQYLRPNKNQRSSNIAFDVGPSRIDQTPSLTSIGITGQLTGNRADIIIADDVETSNNSLTQSARDYLREVVKEFASIVKPKEEGGRVIYLGTPQYEASLYNELRRERGYKCRIWPARYPTAKQLDAYLGCLAPTLAAKLVSPLMAGRPTDPRRFNDAELLEREAELGRSTFALQFMLDTSLSDTERYPLKINDLVMMPLTTETGPCRLSWSSDPHYIADSVPSVGFAGDLWRRPYAVGVDEYSPYTGSVLAIDPSGRGADETAYAVVKILNGRLFLLASGGLRGGYEDETLKELANIAKFHKVNQVLIESNFGDGMFSKVFTPILSRAHPCGIEEVRSNKQKERRIIDTLEPLMNQHRLIVAEDVVINDYRSSQQHERQLFFQMTRITVERGCLGKDDRLDVLAMACAYWVDQMARDVDKAAEESLEEALRREFEGWEQDLGVLSPRNTSWIQHNR